MPSFGMASLPRAPAMTPHPTTPCYFLLSLDTLRSTYFIMKKSFIIATVSLTSFFVLSSVVFAQGATANTAITGINSLSGIVEAFTSTLVKAVGTLFLAGGVVAFFYGVVQYIWGIREGVPAEITKGNKFMGYGLLALFVMFSVYGIIQFAQGTIMPGVDFKNIVIPELNFGKKLPTPTPVTGPGGSPLQPSPTTRIGGSPLQPSPTTHTGGSSGSSFNNTAAVTFCDTDNFSLTECRVKCAEGGGTWDSTNDSCMKGGGSSSSGSQVSADDKTYQCPDGTWVSPSDAKFCPQVSNDKTYECPDGTWVSPSDAKFCPQVSSNTGGASTIACREYLTPNECPSPECQWISEDNDTTGGFCN